MDIFYAIKGIRSVVTFYTYDGGRHKVYNYKNIYEPGIFMRSIYQPGTIDNTE